MNTKLSFTQNSGQYLFPQYTMPHFIFSIIILIAINILDGSFSSFFASIIVYILGLLYSQKVNGENKKYSLKLFFTVYSCYLVSAYIFSLSFYDGNYFLLSDPTSSIAIFDNNYVLKDILNFQDTISSYLNLVDENTIYNIYIRLLAYIANTLFGEASILYATLAHTIFGIFSSTVLYRILLMYFTSEKAYKYALLFALISLFHFYSAVIIRDIIIAFFYLLVIEIVLQKFSFKNLIKLFLLLIIVWGIRLYSGLFVFIFISYYIYVQLHNSRYKLIILPFFIVSVIVIFFSSAVLIQQSLEEIMLYQEFSIERGEEVGGLSNYLLHLPTGIKQVVLTLYSQFHPFPPYAPLLTARTFSQYYMSLLVFIYSIWWAFIFFPLLIFLFLKGAFKKISFEFKMLFFIAIIFIMVNTAHIDVRRMMPVYPILYLLFLIIINNFIPRSYLKKTNIIILFLTLISLTAYLFLIA